jgi:hypothetical protein
MNIIVIPGSEQSFFSTNSRPEKEFASGERPCAIAAAIFSRK